MFCQCTGFLWEKQIKLFITFGSLTLDNYFILRKCEMVNNSCTLVPMMFVTTFLQIKKLTQTITEHKRMHLLPISVIISNNLSYRCPYNQTNLLIRSARTNQGCQSYNQNIQNNKGIYTCICTRSAMKRRESLEWHRLHFCVFSTSQEKNITCQKAIRMYPFV